MPDSPFVEIPEEEQARTAGRAAARAVRLPAGPPYVVVVCRWFPVPRSLATGLFCAHSSVYRTVRADQAAPAGLKHDAQGRLVSRHPHDRAAPDTATVAAGAAPGTPARVWVVPYALELCHAGSDAADHTGTHGLGRDAAALAARTQLGVEASPTGRQRR